MAIGGLLANFFGQSPNAQAAGPGSGGLLGGLGASLSKMRQEQPEALIALGAGIANGGIGEGLDGFSRAVQLTNRDRRASDLQREGWDRDDARFNKSFNLQQQQFGLQQQRANQELAQLSGVNNATAAYLESVGAAPEIISLARAGSGMEAMKLHQSISGDGGTLANNPTYLRDDNGQYHIGQLSNAGGIRLAETPDGMEIVPPRDLSADRASGAAFGKLSGEALASLPGGLMASNRTVSQIDEVINHPGLASVLGPIDSNTPNWMVGEQGRDARARLDQLQGTAFLEAFQMLKGGGAITEIEGAKAEAAMARMGRAQGLGDFQTALRDFRDAVISGQQKLLLQAGVPQDQWGQVLSSVPGASSGGSGSTVVDGITIRRVN